MYIEQNSTEPFLLRRNWSYLHYPPRQINKLAEQYKRLQIFFSLLPCQPLIALAAISLSSAERGVCRAELFSIQGWICGKAHGLTAKLWAWWRRWMRTETGDLFNVFLRKVKHLGLERVRKTRIDRKGNCTRFVFIMFALSYVVSIPFEAGYK